MERSSHRDGLAPKGTLWVAPPPSMFHLYILRSLDKKHWYIGQTNDLATRLAQHNEGLSRSTKAYRPWEIIHVEEFNSQSEVLKRERFLKSPAGYIEWKSIKARYN